MSNEYPRGLTITLQVLCVICILLALWALAAWYETWRANVWAEAMSKHGVQGPVIPGGKR